MWYIWKSCSMHQTYVVFPWQACRLLRSDRDAITVTVCVIVSLAELTSMQLACMPAQHGCTLGTLLPTSRTRRLQQHYTSGSQLKCRQSHCVHTCCMAGDCQLKQPHGAFCPRSVVSGCRGAAEWWTDAMLEQLETQPVPHNRCKPQRKSAGSDKGVVHSVGQ